MICISDLSSFGIRGKQKPDYHKPKQDQMRLTMQSAVGMGTAGGDKSQANTWIWGLEGSIGQCQFFALENHVALKANC